MAKEKKMNEFRKNNSKKGAGHPAHIYARIGDEYIYIGITHAPITEEIQNIPLEKNPNPKENAKAFIRPKPQKAHKASFGAKLKGWAFGPKDKEKVNEVKKKTIISQKDKKGARKK